MKCMLSILIFLLIVGKASTQPPEEGAGLLFGPRVGICYAAARLEDFNSAIQGLFPNPRRYFPLFSQLGISSEQLIRLGKTGSHFSFQELFVIGGLDQNIALPEFSLLFGFKTHFGLNLGLGPDVSIRRVNGNLAISPSLIVAVGWSFRFREIVVPLQLLAVPLTIDGMPRFSLLTGFDFEVLD